MKVAAGTPKQIPPAPDARFPTKPVGYSLHDYEAYILVARRYAMKVCFHHPEWDAGDLEGTILEALLIWPPKNPEKVEHHVNARCKFATADWMRSRLGRQGQKALVFATESLDEEREVVTDQDGTVTLYDIMPDQTAEVDTEALANIIEAWLPKILKHDRDRTVLAMFIEGYNLREIGEVLGVSESRISQILTGRVKPALHRAFSLNSMLSPATLT